MSNGDSGSCAWTTVLENNTANLVDAATAHTLWRLLVHLRSAARTGTEQRVEKTWASWVWTMADFGRSAAVEWYPRRDSKREAVRRTRARRRVGTIIGTKWRVQTTHGSSNGHTKRRNAQRRSTDNLNKGAGTKIIVGRTNGTQRAARWQNGSDRPGTWRVRDTKRSTAVRR